MKKLVLLSMMGSLFLFSQCRKEEAYEPLKKPGKKYEIEKGQAMKADFCGRITNEYGAPVMSALVRVGLLHVTTDADGFFYMEKADVQSNHAYVEVKANGYFHGSRSLLPKNGLNQVSIQLLSNATTGSFASNTGGEVVVGKSRVEFGAGYVTSSGDPYTGTVKVAMKYLDPEAPNLSRIMPGDLLAASSAGSRVLESFGMIAVELRDPTGNTLQLAEGNEAVLHMPLSPSALEKAPDKIPLWYFDEEKGYWQEEGQAIRNGNEFVGKVTHFTFWNCDVPRKYNRIDGVVKASDGLPIAGVNIKLHSNLMGVGTCYTASSGEFGGRVPQDEPFSVEVSYITDEVKKSFKIGPFQADAILPDIILDDQSGLVILEGQIKGCNQVSLSEGVAFLNASIPIAAKNGAYRFLYPAGVPFTVIGYDRNKGDYSTKGNYGGFLSNTTLPEIVICGTGTGQWTWTVGFEIDGKPFVMPNTFGYTVLKTIDLYAGKNQFYLQVNSYKDPGIYTIRHESGDSLWFGDKNDPHCTVAHEVTLDVREYMTNSDLSHLMEMYFSGTVKVWNEQLGQFEIKNLTNGLVKSQR